MQTIVMKRQSQLLNAASLVDDYIDFSLSSLAGRPNLFGLPARTLHSFGCDLYSERISLSPLSPDARSLAWPPAQTLHSFDCDYIVREFHFLSPPHLRRVAAKYDPTERLEKCGRFPQKI